MLLTRGLYKVYEPIINEVSRHSREDNLVRIYDLSKEQAVCVAVSCDLRILIIQHLSEQNLPKRECAISTEQDDT